MDEQKRQPPIIISYKLTGAYSLFWMFLIEKPCRGLTKIVDLGNGRTS
jgi:hypothetical protein